MKNKKKQQVKKLDVTDLDTELVSDLEASGLDAEAIAGGGRGSYGCRAQVGD